MGKLLLLWLDVCVPDPHLLNSYMEGTPTPTVMVFGGGTSERGLGLELSQMGLEPLPSLPLQQVRTQQKGQE